MDDEFNELPKVCCPNCWGGKIDLDTLSGIWTCRHIGCDWQGEEPWEPPTYDPYPEYVNFHVQQLTLLD